MNPNVERVLLEALALLEREGVRYLVMGGIAVAMWGIPRATYDVDLEIELSPEKLPALLDAAEEAGFFFDEAYRKGFTEGVSGLTLVPIKRWTEGYAVTVDLFLLNSPFLREVFKRRVEASIGGKPRPVASAADLILFKLMAWRRKDRMDVQNLLTVQGVPDEGYLRRWSERLGVTDRLEAMLEEWESG